MRNVLEVIDAHRTYISDLDEVAMDAVVGRFIYSPPGEREYDHADMARRTCTCGTVIDGFDEYIDHLRDAIERTIQ